MGETKNSLAEIVSKELKMLPEQQRHLVLVWSRDAKAISDNQSLTKAEKIKLLRDLKTFDVIKPIFFGVTKRLKTTLWDDRSWPSRLALSGVIVGVAATGTEWAGIAAMGSAVGVPFFLVTASGGALLGTVIQELEKSLTNNDRDK